MPRIKPSLFTESHPDGDAPRVKAAAEKPARRPAPPETKKSKRNLRVVFHDGELLVIGKHLAECRQMLVSLEGDKKRIVADFSAKIAAVESEMSVAANAIATGYEFRMVSCTECLGSPTADKKTVRRDDTGELVGIEDMSASEMQRELIPADTAA
jgi:hypothetical protein